MLKRYPHKKIYSTSIFDSSLSSSTMVWFAISGSQRWYPIPCTSVIISLFFDFSYVQCTKVPAFSVISKSFGHILPLLLIYFWKPPGKNSSAITHSQFIFSKYTELQLKHLPKSSHTVKTALLKETEKNQVKQFIFMAVVHRFLASFQKFPSKTRYIS